MMMTNVWFSFELPFFVCLFVRIMMMIETYDLVLWTNGVLFVCLFVLCGFTCIGTMCITFFMVWFDSCEYNLDYCQLPRRRYGLRNWFTKSGYAARGPLFFSFFFSLFFFPFFSLFQSLFSLFYFYFLLINVLILWQLSLLFRARNDVIDDGTRYQQLLQS